MTEAALKGDLVKRFRTRLPAAVILRHEDRFTHGIPDISITYGKRTIWLEVKLADPNFTSKGIQDLTMLRLANAGFGWFVVYWTKNKEKRTYIVDPKDIGKPIEEWENYFDGFNHDWVVEFVYNLV